jgi:type II secretory pathway predicted ATPase ExeA
LNSSGFILIDSCFRPIYANPESINILAYPNIRPALNPESLDGVLKQKIRSFLPHDFSFVQNDCALQFLSGRRSYHCRAFIIGEPWNINANDTRIALIFERGAAGRPFGIRQHRLFAGMYEDPFSFYANPKFYHFCRAHHDVYASLRNLITEKRGLGVLFSASGIGKTALIHYLMESLRHETEIAVFPGSFEDSAELVRSAMAIYGVEGICKDLSENLKLFEKWLLAKQQAGRNVVLICDDAQELDQQTLNNLLLFSKMESGGKKLLQILLAGRQDLLSRLEAAGNERSAETINLYCRLSALDEAEASSYILHRLRIAGCTRQIFSAAALASIALYSRGIPLNINMICRQCLAIAVSSSLQVIDERLVSEVAYDLAFRTTPAEIWSDGEQGAIDQQGMRPRNRRGLRLVDK